MLKKIRPTISELLAPRFILGLLCGSSLILIMLMRYFGLEFAFRDEQVHAHSFLWLLVILGYFYLQLDGLENMSRLRRALSYMLFVYEIHDLLWILSTFRLGVQFTTGTIYPSMSNYIMSCSRDIAMLGISILGTGLKFHFTRRNLLPLLMQAGLWTYTILVKGSYLPFYVYAVVDFLPYVSLAKNQKVELISEIEPSKKRNTYSSSD